MAWMEIADKTRPADGEFVEVELANGSTQLAQFISDKWMVPTSAKAQDTVAVEFNNVSKWRPFAEAKAASKKPSRSSFSYPSSGSTAA